jgi:hypothetical protein
MAAPVELGGRPLLEQQHQYLYSSVSLANAALPSELNFFGYSKGQNVPGAGNFSAVPSTYFHTNMEGQGALPQPKVFTTTGIRVFMPITTSSGTNAPELSDPSFGAAAANNDALEDLLAIANSTVLRFTVGPKDYAHHPCFMFPANTGVAGLAALSQDNGTAATTGSLDTVIPHMVGRYFGLPVYPVVIASQQTFRVTLSARWAANPALNEGHLLFVFLDGLLGREVS